MADIKVIIFDDMLVARGESFNIPGLDVRVEGNADNAIDLCSSADTRPDVVFMDFAMGSDRKNGAEAIRALRSEGYSGKIVAMSSDPVANQGMISAGADDSLVRKTLLRSYLVHLGEGGGNK